MIHLIVLAVIIILTLMFVLGLSRLKTDEQIRQDDEAQIKYIEEYIKQKEKKNKKGMNHK